MERAADLRAQVDQMDGLTSLMDTASTAMELLDLEVATGVQLELYNCEQQTEAATDALSKRNPVAAYSWSLTISSAASQLSPLVLAEPIRTLMSKSQHKPHTDPSCPLPNASAGGRQRRGDRDPARGVQDAGHAREAAGRVGAGTPARRAIRPRRRRAYHSGVLRRPSACHAGNASPHRHPARVLEMCGLPHVSWHRHMSMAGHKISDDCCRPSRLYCTRPSLTQDGILETQDGMLTLSTHAGRRGRAARRRWTGRRCWSACTSAGRRRRASACAYWTASAVRFFRASALFQYSVSSPVEKP